MAYDNKKIAGIMEQVFQIMPQLLDERQRRLLAASIAKGMGMAALNWSVTRAAWISVQYVQAFAK